MSKGGVLVLPLTLEHLDLLRHIQYNGAVEGQLYLSSRERDQKTLCFSSPAQRSRSSSVARHGPNPALREEGNVLQSPGGGAMCLRVESITRLLSFLPLSLIEIRPSFSSIFVKFRTFPAIFLNSVKFRIFPAIFLNFVNFVKFLIFPVIFLNFVQISNISRDFP